MLKYLIFITIGILIFLLLNRYNTFSIGIPWAIPIDKVDGVFDIDTIMLTNTQPIVIPDALLRLNRIYNVSELPIPGDPGEFYFVTDIIPQYAGLLTDQPQLLQAIQSEIDRLERVREREREREREIRDREIERERIESERERRETVIFINRWDLQTNILMNGYIIAYVDDQNNVIIRQINDPILGDIVPTIGIPTIQIDLPEQLYYVIILEQEIQVRTMWWNTIQVTGTILGIGGDVNIDTNILQLAVMNRYLPFDGTFNFINVFNKLSAFRSQYRTHLLQIIAAFLTLQLGGTQQNILNIGQLFRYLNYRGAIPDGVVTTGVGAPSDATQEVPDVVISGTGATMTFRGPSTRRNCAASEGIPPPSERK